MPERTEKAPATPASAREHGRLVGVDVKQGSSNTNRHGIPRRGDPPGKCCWPRCPNAAANWLNLHVCQHHADLVTNAVTDDRNRILENLRRRHEAAAAAAAPPPPPEKPREEVIYYAQMGGHIKIGWTSNLKRRMRSYPPNTRLLAVHPGSRKDEKQLHRRFAVHRSHGQEWYPLVPVLLDHIKRMVAQHGEPPEMTFGAKPVEVRVPKPKPTLQAKYGPMLRG